MSIAADLVEEALAAGLLLSRREDQIHIESPLGCPLPDDLRDRLQAHRRELLDWFAWCERADELLLSCSRRLAAAHPAGCPLDDDGWQIAEEAVHGAYRSQDLALLRDAVRSYEEFANERFQAYERRAR